MTTIAETLATGTTCRTCRFCHPATTSGRQISGVDAGECRRFPPGLDPEDTGMRIWPIVWAHDWCGAFEGMNAERIFDA